MLEAMIVRMEDNMMGETKEIIDSKGKVLNKKKENKTLTFLKENVWNIIGVGLPAAISLISGLNLIVSKSFANSCAEYYGINREYFSENGIFEEQMLVLACALILFIYPFVFSYLTKNEKSKIYVIITGIATAAPFVKSAIVTQVYGLIVTIPEFWKPINAINNYNCSFGDKILTKENTKIYLKEKQWVAERNRSIMIKIFHI